MTEHRTTKDLSIDQENDLICERLLGWKRICDQPDGWEASGDWFWRAPSGTECSDTPRFTSWSDAGLILAALQCVGSDAVPWRRLLGIRLTQGLLDTGYIRVAALEYIRSLR